MPNPYPAELTDESGVERLNGAIAFTDPANQPGGGSQAGAVRRLDLGVVNATDLLGGAVTLYTPDAGEIVGPVFLRDITQTDFYAFAITRDEEDDSSATDKNFPPMAGVDEDTAWDGYWGQKYGGPSIGGQVIAPTTNGPLKAVLKYGLPVAQSVEPWQPNTAYNGTDTAAAVIDDEGNVWSTSDSGTSGASITWDQMGGTTVDNDITWSKENPVPSVGSAHVYADVSVPVAP